MKILMICLGNICRSPMAEGILKHLVLQNDIHDWYIDSAGTGDWHMGEPPDKRAIRTAKNHGIEIADQKARHLNEKDFERFDHLLVMDTMNLQEVKNLAPLRYESNVKLLLDYKYPGQQIIVPDPYYTDLFEQSFQLIYEGCEAFLKHQAISRQ